MSEVKKIMTIQESGEMYLETILILGNNNVEVHAVDISNHMGISKAAVSKAVTKYKNEDLLLVDDSGRITLTNNGLRIAKKTYERHTSLTDFLMQLGVDKDTAVADACRIEHVISDKTFEAMKKHNKKYSKK